MDSGVLPVLSEASILNQNLVVKSSSIIAQSLSSGLNANLLCDLCLDFRNCVLSLHIRDDVVSNFILDVDSNGACLCESWLCADLEVDSSILSVESESTVLDKRLVIESISIIAQSLPGSLNSNEISDLSLHLLDSVLLLDGDNHMVSNSILNVDID